MCPGGVKIDDSLFCKNSLSVFLFLEKQRCCFSVFRKTERLFLKNRDVPKIPVNASIFQHFLVSQIYVLDDVSEISHLARYLFSTCATLSDQIKFTRKEKYFSWSPLVV